MSVEKEPTYLWQGTVRTKSEMLLITGRASINGEVCTVSRFTPSKKTGDLPDTLRDALDLMACVQSIEAKAAERSSAAERSAHIGHDPFYQAREKMHARQHGMVA